MALEMADVAKVGAKNWVNFVAYLVNFGVTYGSLTGAFGKTNEELSAKYQTLITPAGYAFAIWGPIFLWEGAFAVAQLFPRFRQAPVVVSMTPWWVGACVFQVAWTLFFAQELIPGALVCMLGILTCLVGGIVVTDCLPGVPVLDYWLLRAPFSLHAGWIIAASALNICVAADYARAPPEILLALAVACFCGIAIAVNLFALTAPKADAVIPLVACWALLGIFVELGQPDRLRDPSRFNFFAWPSFVLEGIRTAALILVLVSALAAALAGLRGLLVFRQARKMAAIGSAAEEVTAPAEEPAANP